MEDQNLTVLEKPYTLEELLEKMDDRCYVKAHIAVPFDGIIKMDIEELNDFVSMKMTDNVLLSDISYKAVGVRGDDIVIEVRGDVSETISDMESDIQD